MLTGIRQAFETGVMRFVLIVLMGMLVFSFAIWGVGDIFRGGSSTTLAQVGSTQVTVQSFQTVYNREVQNLGRQFGRGVTPEQARLLGLDRSVLQQLTTEATLDERARLLGLGLDDETVRNRIVTNPNYAPGGRFDRAGFAELLRANGLTEAGFFELERRLAVRQQIAAAITDRAAPPRVMLDLLARYEGETRVADFLVISAKNVGDIAEPDAATLERFFDQRRAVFRAPEYRRFVTIVLTPADQAPFMQVPDARLDAEFARVRDTAERRLLQQLTFPNVEEAAAAVARIRAGVPIEDIARERNVAVADLNLGSLSRGEVADPAVREAAFALADSAVSDPIRGRFGTVVVRVAGIAPFDAVRAREEVRQRLAADMARAAVNETHDRIERERLAGVPLADIAGKVGMETRVIEAVAADGTAPDGTALDIPGAREFLTAAFRADIGFDNDPVTLRATGAYIWYEVAQITPARERTFDEARERVLARWREDEVKDRIAKAATEMVRLAREGKALADIARETNYEVRATKPLNRSETDGDWGSVAVQTLFVTPRGQTTNALATDGVDQIVFVVREVNTPAGRTLEARIQEQIRQALGDELLAQHVRRLQSDLGLTVNQTLLRRATGGES